MKVRQLWYLEPYLSVNFVNLTAKSLCEVNGTFRHMECSRVSILGGGFQDMICEYCWSIQQCTDFRLQVFRESISEVKRGERETRSGLRLSYMIVSEILRQGRLHSGTIRQQKKMLRKLQHRLVMLQARIPKLREMCLESVNQGDLLKFCQAITLAHRRGTFGGIEALWDLLRDIAFNLNRSAQGHRYRKGTKLISQALFQHGARRVVDCLSNNMIGPSLNTLQRDKRGMIVFRVGIHVEQFRFIVEVYTKIKMRNGMEAPLPCFLAEDETYVKRTVRWSPKHDTLLGFCGKQIDHICIPGLEIKAGEDEQVFKNITEAFEQYVIGHQARCIMVNPMHEKFPKLCLVAISTCGKFDVV